MRTGKLDRKIAIERYGDGSVDAYGTPAPTWTALATLRASIVQAGTDEYIRAYGAAEETVIIFRTHYLAGVTTADRIAYEGAYFNINEIKELGRRKGLELRCVRVK